VNDPNQISTKKTRRNDDWKQKSQKYGNDRGHDGSVKLLPNAGVSNWNCSEGQMRACKVSRGRIITTRGPHFDADATMAAPEPQ